MKNALVSYMIREDLFINLYTALCTPLCDIWTFYNKRGNIMPITSILCLNGDGFSMQYDFATCTLSTLRCDFPSGIYPAFELAVLHTALLKSLKCFAHGIAYKNIRARQIKFIILHLQHWLHVTSHSRDFTTPLFLQWIPSHATAPVSSLCKLFWFVYYIWQNVLYSCFHETYYIDNLVFTYGVHWHILKFGLRSKIFIHLFQS